MRASGPSSWSKATSGVAAKGGQKATCKLPVRWPAAKTMRSQPASSSLPSAAWLRVSCWRTSSAGASSAAAGSGNSSPTIRNCGPTCGVAAADALRGSRHPARRHAQPSSMPINIQNADKPPSGVSGRLSDSPRSKTAAESRSDRLSGAVLLRPPGRRLPTCRCSAAFASDAVPADWQSCPTGETACAIASTANARCTPPSPRRGRRSRGRRNPTGRSAAPATRRHASKTAAAASRPNARPPSSGPSPTRSLRGRSRWRHFVVCWTVMVQVATQTRPERPWHTARPRRPWHADVGVGRPTSSPRRRPVRRRGRSSPR